MYFYYTKLRRGLGLLRMPGRPQVARSANGIKEEAASPHESLPGVAGQ
jgi:hypothetical protein